MNGNWLPSKDMEIGSGSVLASAPDEKKKTSGLKIRK